MTVRVVLEELNASRRKGLAYTTVMTVMNRLAAKGILARTLQGGRYLYEATAPDEAGIAVARVIQAHGKAALAHFLEQARSDPSLLRRLEALLQKAT